jgi:hypothetical protein
MSEYATSMGQTKAVEGPAAWLNGFFELLQLDVSATESETDDTVEIDIQGADAGRPLRALPTPREFLAVNLGPSNPLDRSWSAHYCVYV